MINFRRNAPLLIFTLYITVSCTIFKDSNEKAINIGASVLNQKSDNLDSIVPICNTIFLDTCQVFYILTSPTTDLFHQGSWDSNFSYRNDMLLASPNQMNDFNSLMVKPELTNVYFCKNVFIAFGLSGLNHSDDGVWIVKILDENKFFNLHKLKILNNKSKSKPKTDWLYRYNDEWVIVSCDLTKSFCNY